MRILPSALALAALSASSALAQGAPDLGAALHLRPDQQAAYARFQHDAGPDRARARQQAVQARTVTRMTTPERLNFTIRRVEDDLAELRREAPAVKAFYAQLSPDQRRTFDRITLPAPPEDAGRP